VPTGHQEPKGELEAPATVVPQQPTHKGVLVRGVHSTAHARVAGAEVALLIVGRERVPHRLFGLALYHMSAVVDLSASSRSASCHFCSTRAHGPPSPLEKHTQTLARSPAQPISWDIGGGSERYTGTAHGGRCWQCQTSSTPCFGPIPPTATGIEKAAATLGRRRGDGQWGQPRARQRQRRYKCGCLPRPD
jgi:hypothetical protein